VGLGEAVFALSGAQAIEADRESLAEGVEPVGVRGVSVRSMRGGGTVRAGACVARGLTVV